jgi:rubredoxin
MSDVGRDGNECPECGADGIENPVLDGWYECNNCVISFNPDGEVENERF